jgi:predicted Zn-dependent protease
MSLGIFENCKFVVVSNVRAMNALVRVHGGTVCRKVDAQTHYLVQSWLDDMSDSQEAQFALALRYAPHCQIVPPSFISACVERGQLVDVIEHAIGAQWKFARSSIHWAQNACIERLVGEDEVPQSFDEFDSPKADRRRDIGVRSNRNVLYIQSLIARRSNSRRASDLISALADLLGAFFHGMRVICTSDNNASILDDGDDGDECVVRVRYDADDRFVYPAERRRGRVRAIDVLESAWPQCKRAHRDVAMLALITDVDLFEVADSDEPFWGRAIGDGAAIASFHCFEATKRAVSSSSSSKTSKTPLYYVFNTIAHELAHTLGIDHCHHYKCLMNSVEASVDNIEATVLCPIDLHKLCHALDVDSIERAQRLIEAYAKHGKHMFQLEIKAAQLFLEQHHNVIDYSD